MNKKGFTLIEILAIVVLIGVVAVIAVPNITKQADEHSAKQTKLVREQITNAAKMYFSRDEEKIEVLLDATRCVNYDGTAADSHPDKACEVSIDTLITEELLSLGNNDTSSFSEVFIKRSSGTISYEIK